MQGKGNECKITHTHVRYSRRYRFQQSFEHVCGRDKGRNFDIEGLKENAI